MTINAFYSVEVTSTGAPQSISVGTGLDSGTPFINVKNLTAYSATAPSATLPVEVQFFPNSSVTDTVGSGISPTDTLVPLSLSSGGISVGSTIPMTTGTPLAITSITAANPAVVTCASTASLAGVSAVWVSYATGMQQIAQMPFSITVIDATTFELTYLDASGFAAPATAGVVVPITNYGSAVSPFTGAITSIVSSGTQTLVQTSVAQNFQVGQMYQFSIPSLYGGMQQLNLNTGRYTPSNLGGYEVTAYDAATNTITLNVNSSQMGAFAFPSNATVLTQPAGIVQSAQISLSGTYWGSLSDVGSRNTATWYINLGTAVCGRSGDILQITYGWLGN